MTPMRLDPAYLACAIACATIAVCTGAYLLCACWLAIAVVLHRGWV